MHINDQTVLLIWRRLQKTTKHTPFQNDKQNCSVVIDSVRSTQEKDFVTPIVPWTLFLPEAHLRSKNILALGRCDY